MLSSRSEKESRPSATFELFVLEIVVALDEVELPSVIDDFEIILIDIISTGVPCQESSITVGLYLAEAVILKIPYSRPQTGPALKI